jgi:hypothetical protein
MEQYFSYKELRTVSLRMIHLAGNQKENRLTFLLHWKLGNKQSISTAGKLTTGATYTTGNYKVTFEEVLCGGATGSDRVRMHNQK